MGTEKSPIWFQVSGLVSLIWPGLERTAEQGKENRRTAEPQNIECRRVVSLRSVHF